MEKLSEEKHLYRDGAEASEKKAFEERYEKEGYTKQQSDDIYFATVEKVKKEQKANGTYKPLKRKKSKRNRRRHK